MTYFFTKNFYKLKYEKKNKSHKIKKIYGKKNFISILSKRGDVIIANTVAFHRGIKPMKKDMNIVTLNYGHIDFTFNNKFDITSTIVKKQYKYQTKGNQSILSLLNKA